jgi:predicted AlkP superfamily pyrophosphatase or phosphodiesterase
MKKTIALFLSLVLALLCGSVAFAEDADSSFGAYEHVFIIGVDGAGAAFSQVDSPCFDAIFGDYAYRHDAHTETVTVSAQNWGSILTGVDYKTHGFTNTNLKLRTRDSGAKNHSIFYYVRQAMPQAELVSFNNWDAINHGIVETDLGVKKINCKTDPQVVSEIEAYLNAGNAPALMFVQLDSVDHAAHTHGGFSDAYFTAVRRADSLVGRIYNAVVANGLMENGLFLLVADHGESEHGHGGRTVEERSAVLAAVGRTVNKTQMSSGVHNRDVSAISLYALGVAQPEQFVSAVPAGLFGAQRDVPGAVAIGEGDYGTADLDDDPPFDRAIINFFEKAYHAIVCFLLTWMYQF